VFSPAVTVNRVARVGSRVCGTYCSTLPVEKDTV
jgi:hypothetical protein